MTSDVGLTGIILAGGRSRRLGRDKTTMPWPPDGVPATQSHCQTLLEATGATLETVCDDVLVVAYRGEQPLPYPVVPDLYADGGSLGGIYSGLTAAPSDFALAVATDMPFLCAPLLRWMAGLPRDYDVLVPVREEPEPLHAIYSKRCLEPMRHRLEAGRLKITGFFADVRVRYVEQDTLASLDPEGLSFFNVNTPEDLAQARRILQSRQLSAE
ncbi:MAG TPA: molybdenum cofactor guanylyltransferase [Chloroflexota bacterium]|nr:molybdenum cofactor guanylyltransferase [Chloroflexota bacterium]